MTSHEVTIDDRVFAYLRTPDACSPDWVRIVLLRDRTAGDGAAVHGSANLVFVWNRGTRRVERGIIDYSASRNYQIGKYFKTEFDVPNWTRVVAVCDIDGNQYATVTVDPAGPSESHYLAGFDDPVFQHLDEHRAELEALARRHYGAG